MKTGYSSLKAWQAACQKQGLRFKLVTRGKRNHYWQAYGRDGAIVGFYNDPQLLKKVYPLSGKI
jgi:hypothetical protein